MSNFNLCALSAVLFFLQASFFPFVFNGVTQPDLWLCVTAISALMLDKRSAWILALVGGFLQDLVIGNFFGLHLLPYLIITFLFTKFGRQRYNRHWYISVVAVFFASLDYAILSGLVMWSALGQHPALSYLISMCLRLMVVNGLAALFFHPILWKLKREVEPLW